MPVDTRFEMPFLLIPDLTPDLAPIKSPEGLLAMNLEVVRVLFS